MKTSEHINDLAAALAKAQGVLHGAVKDAENPFFKSNYADLASCWEACRAPLSANGLSIVQCYSNFFFGDQKPPSLMLVTRLMHSSGQWIEGSVLIEPVKKDPQGVGSATTYLRRYSLAAMVGLVQVDDDGNEASRHPEKRMERSLTMPTTSVALQEPPRQMFAVPTELMERQAESYRIEFGKFKGRSLSEVGVEELKSYSEYIQKKAKSESKPLSNTVENFIKRAEIFIASQKNVEPPIEDVPF